MDSMADGPWFIEAVGAKSIKDGSQMVSSRGRLARRAFIVIYRLTVQDGACTKNHLDRVSRKGDKNG